MGKYSLLFILFIAFFTYRIESSSNLNKNKSSVKTNSSMTDTSLRKNREPAKVDTASNKKNSNVSSEIKMPSKLWIDVGTNESFEETSEIPLLKELLGEENFSSGLKSNKGNKVNTNSKSGSYNNSRNNKNNDEVFREPPTPSSKVIARGEDGSTAFSLWYPMCLFMDAAVVSESQGNATVRQMTKDAADCGVNLIIFPVTVSPGSYSRDPDAANQQQINACNVVGNVGNATRASTSLCEDSDTMADEMCDSYERNPPRPTKTVAGCAMLGGSPAEKALIGSIKQRMKRQGKDPSKMYEEGNGSIPSGGGAVAASLEDRGNCVRDIVNHEAIGHSMFGHLHGANPVDGFGIGVGDGKASGGTWAQNSGCAAMRRNAFTNDGRWRYNPKTTTYYKQPPPNEWFDLSSGNRLFGSPASKPRLTVRSKFGNTSKNNRTPSGLSFPSSTITLGRKTPKDIFSSKSSKQGESNLDTFNEVKHKKTSNSSYIEYKDSFPSGKDVEYSPTNYPPMQGNPNLPNPTIIYIDPTLTKELPTRKGRVGISSNKDNNISNKFGTIENKLGYDDFIK